MKNYSLYSSQKFLPDGNISVERKTISNHYSHTHCHDYFEIEVVLDGFAKERLNGNEYERKRGFIALLSPLDFHQIYFEKETSFYNIAFNESIISKEILSKGIIFLVLMETWCYNISVKVCKLRVLTSV